VRSYLKKDNLSKVLNGDMNDERIATQRKPNQGSKAGTKIIFVFENFFDFHSSFFISNPYLCRP
jgi:hypothetical protein